MDKKVFKIWCEWEIGLEYSVYATEELAQKAIDEYDWEGNTEYTLKEVQEDGFVNIETLDFIDK